MYWRNRVRVYAMCSILPMGLAGSRLRSFSFSISGRATNPRVARARLCPPAYKAHQRLQRRGRVLYLGGRTLDLGNRPRTVGDM